MHGTHIEKCDFELTRSTGSESHFLQSRNANNCALCKNSKYTHSCVKATKVFVGVVTHCNVARRETDNCWRSVGGLDHNDTHRSIHCMLQYFNTNSMSCMEGDNCIHSTLKHAILVGDNI